MALDTHQQDKSGLDVAALRADTRGCTNVDTMVEHLRLEELIGGYEAHARAGDRINAVRDSIGALLDTSGSNIALSNSATDSWDRAFVAIKFANDYGPGTRICQSVGQLPVDAVAVGADFLSVTGRKFVRGPRGTGFMYCSPRALSELEPFPADLFGTTWTPDGYTMRSDAQRFEAWEKSYAAILGLGAAVDYSLTLGLDAIKQRINYLAKEMRCMLDEIPGIKVLDRGIEKSGIITLRHERVDSAVIVAGLKELGINVSLGTPEYSQVDYLAHGVTSMVRVSPHIYNTLEELERCAEVVRGLSS